MSGKSILIVDDDKPLLVGLTARLKANGYRVLWATDGVSAITVAVAEAPDLVILDLGLPAGDGFMVLERLKNLGNLATTPVIVLSAKNPAENEKRSLDAGAIAFFQKPPDNHEFLTAIRSALGDAPALESFLQT
jgi:DNA-binding response OmpR family regulator